MQQRTEARSHLTQPPLEPRQSHSAGDGRNVTLGVGLNASLLPGSREV